MKNLVILLFISFISVPTLAVNTWHDSKVKRIYPQSGGNVVVTFKTPSAHCSRADNYHFISDGVNGVKQEGIKSMLSVLLTAATLDKVVSVNFDKDSPSCDIHKLSIEF